MSTKIDRVARPFVTLNVASGVDGKIAPVGGGKVNFGSAEDRALMESLRAEADAVLIGGGTLRSEDPPLLIRDQEVCARRLAAKGSEQPWNVVVTANLPADPGGMDFFREPSTRKLVFTTEHVLLDAFAKTAEFARVEVVDSDSEGRVALVPVLDRLWNLGVRHLLLEGGGELNFSMLAANLIDEVYLTLCPFVFGGRNAPTSFDGAGFPREHVRKLALKSHRVGSSGEIFLRYDLLADPVVVSVSPLFRQGFEIR